MYCRRPYLLRSHLVVRWSTGNRWAKPPTQPMPYNTRHAWMRRQIEVVNVSTAKGYIKIRNVWVRRKKTLRSDSTNQQQINVAPWHTCCHLAQCVNQCIKCFTSNTELGTKYAKSRHNRFACYHQVSFSSSHFFRLPSCGPTSRCRCYLLVLDMFVQQQQHHYYYTIRLLVRSYTYRIPAYMILHYVTC